MSSPPRSWLARRIEDALREGFARAYETLRVDPDRYLFQLRTAHGLPIATFRGMATLPIEVVDEVADQTIRAGMKMAAAEGAGPGLGGLIPAAGRCRSPRQPLASRQPGRPTGLGIGGLSVLALCRSEHAGSKDVVLILDCGQPSSVDDVGFDLSG